METPPRRSMIENFTGRYRQDAQTVGSDEGSWLGTFFGEEFVAGDDGIEAVSEGSGETFALLLPECVMIGVEGALFASP